MIKAEAEGIAPEELIRRLARNTADYAGFLISLTSCTRPIRRRTRRCREDIYRRLKAAGHINSTPVRSSTTRRGMFLADRYVKGECPNCHSTDQYGDSCESCGHLRPDELIIPYSTLTGTPPVLRDSDHFFFKLGEFAACFANGSKAATPAAAGRAKLRRMVRGGLAGLGHLARCALLRFRDSRMRPANISTCGSMHRSAISASYSKWSVRQGREPKLRGIPAAPTRDRAVSLHRQGHHLLPHAVLARHAALCGRRLPGASTCTCTASSPSRARRCRSRAARSSPRCATSRWACIRSGCATTSPPSSDANVDDIDFNLDDFVARVNSDLVGK